MVNLIFLCLGCEPDASERTWHVDVSTGKSIIGAQKVETKPDNGSWRRQQLFAIDRLNWKVMLATIQRLTSASRQGSITQITQLSPFKIRTQIEIIIPSPIEWSEEERQKKEKKRSNNKHFMQSFTHLTDDDVSLTYSSRHWTTTSGFVCIDFLHSIRICAPGECKYTVKTNNSIIGNRRSV